MAKYKHYDYSQKALIPVNLEEQLVPGTLEFAIHTLVDTRIDMSIFDDRYKNDDTGRLAYDPKILLKIILLGYSRGLIGSRKIEKACRENVTFMALSCGQKPDHSTIAAFVSTMKDEIKPIFRDVLLVCDEEKLLGSTFFAVDGCRISSNASREWSGKILDLKRKKEKIEKKVEQLINQQEKEDKSDDDEKGDGGSTGLSDREKQIGRLQKQADKISDFLKENDKKIGKQGKEIQSNVTDNESCTMKSSHGITQGYNAQALVDDKHQVIIHGEAFGDSQDHSLIKPMVDGAKENIKDIGRGEDYFEGKILTADSNYHDPDNLKKCEEEKIDAYIPDKRFRKRDSRFQNERRSKGGRFTLKDFVHNVDKDEYCCPKGKILRLIVKKTVVDGVIYNKYAADKEDCAGCEFKLKCMINPKGERRMLSVPIGHIPGNLSKAMADKIDGEKGRKIYSQRIAIVEPVFANITTHKRMDRFTLRSKIKVNIQWMLYCMVHNIGKIMAYGCT